MILLLSSRQIIQSLPYKILNENELDVCLDNIFKHDKENLHFIASVMLYSMPKSSFAENQMVSSLCITDALLRVNKKKISIGYVTDPSLNKSQQIAKTIAMLGDILTDRISVGDINSWLLWHVIDTTHGDDIWDFHQDEHELIALASRFSINANSTKQQILSEYA